MPTTRSFDSRDYFYIIVLEYNSIHSVSSAFIRKTNSTLETKITIWTYRFFRALLGSMDSSEPGVWTKNSEMTLLVLSSTKTISCNKSFYEECSKYYPGILSYLHSEGV